MKRKIKSAAAPFTPRAGMSFVKNVARNAPRVVLKELNGRTWKAESLINNGRYKIDAGELHERAYHDGWSLIKPENELPDKFGKIDVDENVDEIFGELLSR